MDDDVVTVCVVRFAVDRQIRMGASICNEDKVHLRISSRLNAFLQNVFLLFVIVAAAAGDQKHSEWFWRVGRRRWFNYQAEHQSGCEEQELF